MVFADLHPEVQQDHSNFHAACADDIERLADVDPLLGRQQTGMF